MRIELKIDTEMGFILTRATGRLTFHDLLEYNFALSNDPRLTLGMVELTDFRFVDRLELSFGEFCQLAEAERARLDVYGASFKEALVAASPCVFGLCLMYRTLTQVTYQNIRVFSDISEARAYLRLPF